MKYYSFNHMANNVQGCNFSGLSLRVFDDAMMSRNPKCNLTNATETLGGSTVTL